MGLRTRNAGGKKGVVHIELAFQGLKTLHFVASGINVKVETIVACGAVASRPRAVLSRIRDVRLLAPS